MVSCVSSIVGTESLSLYISSQRASRTVIGLTAFVTAANDVCTFTAYA